MADEATISERKSVVTPVLIGALITILLAVSTMGKSEIDSKVDISAFYEYKEAELRRDIRMEGALDRINDKLDRLIELRISERK